MPTLDRGAIKPKRYRRPCTYYDYGAKYYNSTLWHNLRNSYIHKNPLCEECMKDGVVRPATRVHHIKPFMSGLSEDERWQLLTDVHNLMAVCDLCHHKLHRNLNKKY